MIDIQLMCVQAGQTVPMSSLLLADPTKSYFKLSLWRQAAVWVERISAGDVIYFRSNSSSFPLCIVIIKSLLCYRNKTQDVAWRGGWHDDNVLLSVKSPPAKEISSSTRSKKYLPSCVAELPVHVVCSNFRFNWYV